MSWSSARGALLTEPITARQTIRIGLRVDALTLDVLDETGNARSSYALPGHTIAEAHQWLAAAMANEGLDGTRLTSRKHYTIPSHVVATGAAFSTIAIAERAELSRYWSNAAGYLEKFGTAISGAEPVRTWPHHFDIATLIVLPQSASGTTRTIGVGMSPGDDSYQEPYWYVGPQPRIDPANAATLGGGGHWHTDGWIGGALPASDYVDALDQRAQVHAFVESAVTECRRLLDETMR
jgi:hypothetical protein